MQFCTSAGEFFISYAYMQEGKTLFPGLSFLQSSLRLIVVARSSTLLEQETEHLSLGTPPSHYIEPYWWCNMRTL
jgi:hypothetical protein